MSVNPNFYGHRVRRPSSYALLGVVGISLCTLLVAQKDQAQKATKVESHSKTAADTSTKELVIEAKAESKPVETLNKDGRRSLEFYTSGAKSTLFSEPLPPEPKPAPPPKPTPPPPPVKLPEIDPFAGWAYTGTVTVNNQKMVLLENATTKEGQYLHIGEMFMGGQVSDITDANVILMIGNKPRQLFKSQNYNIVPLNANAPGAGTPGQPGPGAVPGGAPPPPPPPNMGAPMMGQMDGAIIRSMGRSGRIMRMKR